MMAGYLCSCLNLNWFYDGLSVTCAYGHAVAINNKSEKKLRPEMTRPRPDQNMTKKKMCPNIMKSVSNLYVKPNSCMISLYRL